MQTYFSNGKLLLTGEYVVLDGALSLGIPTGYGQSLNVEPFPEAKLIWNSLDENGDIWFEGVFNLDKGQISVDSTSDQGTSDRLLQILTVAGQLNSGFLNSNSGFKVTTKLDFPKHWGLGTSSTLVNNVSNWAQIDPYLLLESTFGGSGYDIACAQHDKPITYQNRSSSRTGITSGRDIFEVDFNPSFKTHLYFIHLNKKQDSREGIKHYKAQKKNFDMAIREISAITSEIIECTSLREFEALITEHEQIISGLTNQIPVKQLLFSDFPGAMKSLGAWGGDFILATSEDHPGSYFKDKGYHTIIPYDNMIL